MAWFNSKAKRLVSSALAAGVILSATCVVVAFPGTALADDHRGRGEHRGGDWNHGRRGFGGGEWNRGYYREPPVVYRSPYYSPPPVVYGSPFGLNIHIR
jgi:hypothetical protein